MTTDKVIYGDDTTIDVFNDDYGKSDYGSEFEKMILDSVFVPDIGKVQKATYVADEENEFLLDAKFKDLVRVPKNREERNFFEKFEIGSEVDVLVTKITNNPDYTINGSVAVIHREMANQELRSLGHDDHVMAHIDELTAAGYKCTIMLNESEIHAFLPQILAGVNKIREDMRAELVGQTLEFCLEGYADDKGTWIISRRKYLKKLLDKNISHYFFNLTG